MAESGERHCSFHVELRKTKHFFRLVALGLLSVLEFISVVSVFLLHGQVSPHVSDRKKCYVHVKRRLFKLLGLKQHAM